jgi:hypothetical protein
MNFWQKNVGKVQNLADIGQRKNFPLYVYGVETRRAFSLLFADPIIRPKRRYRHTIRSK